MKFVKHVARWFAVLLVAGAFALPAVAAPITFQFEAEIDTILDSIPFDSGLDVHLGDKITGWFTFDPQIAVGQPSLEVVQPYSATLLIDGKFLATSMSNPDFTIRSSNDSGIVDFPPATVIDLIELGGTLAPDDPVLLPNVSPNSSSFIIRLWGDDLILDNAGFPSNPAVWNSFQFTRTILVGIRGDSGKVLGINATIHDFAIVPEPTTVSLELLAISILTGRRTKNAQS